MPPQRSRVSPEEGKEVSGIGRRGWLALLGIHSRTIIHPRSGHALVGQAPLPRGHMGIVRGYVSAQMKGNWVSCFLDTYLREQWRKHKLFGNQFVTRSNFALLGHCQASLSSCQVALLCQKHLYFNIFSSPLHRNAEGRCLSFKATRINSSEERSFNTCQNLKA